MLGLCTIWSSLCYSILNCSTIYTFSCFTFCILPFDSNKVMLGLQQGPCWNWPSMLRDTAAVSLQSFGRDCSPCQRRSFFVSSKSYLPWNFIFGDFIYRVLIFYFFAFYLILFLGLYADHYVAKASLPILLNQCVCSYHGLFTCSQATCMMPRCPWVFILLVPAWCWIWYVLTISYIKAYRNF